MLAILFTEVQQIMSVLTNRKYNSWWENELLKITASTRIYRDQGEIKNILTPVRNICWVFQKTIPLNCRHVTLFYGPYNFI